MAVLIAAVSPSKRLHLHWLIPRRQCRHSKPLSQGINPAPEPEPEPAFQPLKPTGTKAKQSQRRLSGAWTFLFWDFRFDGDRRPGIVDRGNSHPFSNRFEIMLMTSNTHPFLADNGGNHNALNACRFLFGAGRAAQNDAQSPFFLFLLFLSLIPSSLVGKLFFLPRNKMYNLCELRPQ